MSKSSNLYVEGEVKRNSKRIQKADLKISLDFVCA